MHSRVIALNEYITDYELMELMPAGTDYVIEMGRDKFLEEATGILEPIGTVIDGCFSPDYSKIEEELDRLYHQYLENEIECFSDFIDSGKVWRARNALEDNYGYLIYSDWGLETWAEFLRRVYNARGKGWEMNGVTIEGVYDYHF